MTHHEIRTSFRPHLVPLRTWLGAACAAALLIALFTIPYHVPVPPSFSDSYVFGYSNRAGAVIVGLFTILAAFILASPKFIPRSGKPLTRATLLKALAVTLLPGIPLFLLTYRLDGFLESVYTVDRTRLLLEGHTAYRDFEFCYGLLALYGPAFLVRAFHLTVPAACDLFFLAACLLGVCQLYLILAWSQFPSPRQREVFLILFVLFLPALLATTTAYTLPRFLTGGLFAMLSHRLLTRGNTRDRLLALLLPIPAAAIIMLISPEMGLAYTVGITLYLFRFGRLRRPLYLAAYLTMLTGLACVLFLAARLGAFITLITFGDGAFNFPIVPAPHILLFLAALAVYAAYLGPRLRTGENTPMLALGSIAPAMLPAAFGRCDPAHVMFDGILVLIIALLVCASSSRVPRLLLPLVVAIFLLLPTVLGLRALASTITLLSLPYLLHSQPSQDAFVERLTLRLWGPVKGPANFRHMQARRTRDQPVDLATTFGLPANTIYAAPFAFTGDHSGVYHSPSIDEGYFLSVVDMVSPADVRRKLAELDLHPERPLLLPAGAEFTCTIRPEAARHEIASLFAYPYSAPAVHPGDVTEPLCATIRTKYHVVRPAAPERFGYALWLRNSAPSSEPARPAIR